MYDSVGGVLGASLLNGASCTPEGVSFDGVDDYVDIDSWYWGGTTSFETYAMFLSHSQSFSRIFDFGSGCTNNNFLLDHEGTSSTLGLNIYDGATSIAAPRISGVWSIHTWRHIVGVASNNQVNFYVDGSFSSYTSSTSGTKIPFTTRSNAWLGRSSCSGDGYFQGYIAYLRIWHGIELVPSNVVWLYNNRCGQYPSVTDAAACPGGLTVTVFDGYYSDNFDFFHQATAISPEIAPASSFISPATAIDWEQPDSSSTYDYLSVVYEGYFVASATGSWSFCTMSDDSSWLWLGGIGESLESLKARRSLYNAVVNNGGTHDAESAVCGNINLVEGFNYPFLVYYGEDWGGASIKVGNLGWRSLGRK